MTIMVRGKYFLAHKLVFSLYTDHFQSPKGLGFDAIHYMPPEVEPEIFELLLEYSYTGSVNCRAEQDTKLLRLGQILDIKDLTIDQSGSDNNKRVSFHNTIFFALSNIDFFFFQASGN